MSVHATSWVWKYSATKGAARLVMLCLADYAGRDGGDCYPSQKTIAGDCGIHIRTVQRALDECIDLGEVTIEEEPQQHRSTRYRLTMATQGDREAVDNENLRGDISPPLANSEATSRTSRGDILSNQGWHHATRSTKEPSKNQIDSSQIELRTVDNELVDTRPLRERHQAGPLDPSPAAPFEAPPPGGFDALRSVIGRERVEESQDYSTDPDDVSIEEPDANPPE